MTTGSKRIKLSELFLESIDRNTQAKELLDSMTSDISYHSWEVQVDMMPVPTLDEDYLKSWTCQDIWKQQCHNGAKRGTKLVKTMEWSTRKEGLKITAVSSCTSQMLPSHPLLRRRKLKHSPTR